MTNLVEHLLRLRDMSHLYHFKVKSYSAHVAIEDFYTKLLDFTDDIVETIQGESGSLLNITIKQSQTTDDILPILEASREFINSIRGEYSIPIQAIIDEVINLINKTVYKIKFLK